MKAIPVLVTFLAVAPFAPERRAGSRPQEESVRCTKCGNAGRLPCPEHARRDVELEDDALYCSLVGGCAVCGGTGWIDCPKCESPATEARLAAKRASQPALEKEAAALTDAMGRGLRLAISEHFVVVFEVGRMKVGKRNLSGHEMLHLYLDRLERLYADYTSTLGVEDSELRRRPRVMIWSNAADHARASARFCRQTAKGGVKLMGADPNYSVPALKRFFKDDEALHRNVIHNTVHLLLSHQTPSRWIGQIRGGWADAGLAHWFEDRYFGICDNYCYQEVFTSRRLQGDKWRVRARKLVATDSTPPLAELVQENTETLSEPQHLMSFSLVDFLMQKDPKVANDLFRQLRSKTPTRDAVQAVYGWKLLDLERRWKAWVLESYPSR